MRLFALSSLCAVGTIAATASADMTNYRDWVDANGLTSNTPGQLWCGTTGVGGAMMTSNGTSWRSEGQPLTWPMLGPIINPGEYGGTAGPATFAGLWGRPGANLPAVLVFAPQAAMWVSGITVQSELVANGLMGDGVTITVLASIGGVSSNLGTVTLAHTTEARLDYFALSSMTQMNAGDTLSVVIGNNGSYLYDHVNFNAWTSVPGPGGLAMLLGAGLARGRRRRQ